MLEICGWSVWLVIQGKPETDACVVEVESYCSDCVAWYCAEHWEVHLETCLREF